MSPEQAKVGPIDGRTDLYSLGATLYELLALRPPFEGRSAVELIEQIAHRDPISPRQFDQKIPKDLETIVLKLLAKRPADRYASAAEVSADLTRFANLEPVKARRISPVGRLWRFARRHPGITAVSTAAAITVLTVSTIAYVKVLQQRDVANQALAKTESEMRWRLLHQASFIRTKDFPNRRAPGLALIKDAATRHPEPELRAKLRNEAIEFLAMRDVEERDPFPTGRTRGIVFGPDGSRLASVGDSPDGRTFRLWDVSQRKSLVEKPIRPSPNRGGGGQGSEKGQGRPGPGGASGRFWPWGSTEGPPPVLAAAGHGIALLAPDGQAIHLFDASTGAKISDLKLPGRRVLGFLTAPEGQRIVTLERAGATQPGGNAGARVEINLWDSEHTDAPLATLAKWGTEPGQVGPPDLPLAAISPDGKTVVTAHAHKSIVSVWSADTGKESGPAFDVQAEVTALALGPDDQLATAGSGEVRLWDLDSRTLLPSSVPNPSNVRLLRFSPRGSLLAVGGFLGRSVELWDTASHALVAVLPTADPVDDVAFSPDGRSLAAAGQGANTTVWAILDPDVRARVSGFDAMTRVIAFRADGLLALGRWNGAIRFWCAGRCVNSSSESKPDLAVPTSGYDPGPKDDPATRDHQALLAFDDQGRLLSLEPDALRVWEAPPKGSDLFRVPKTGGPGALTRMSPLLAISADGRTLALTRGAQLTLWTSNDPMNVRTVNLPGAQRGSQRGSERDRPSPPRLWGAKALAVATGGKRLYYIDNFGLHALTIEEEPGGDFSSSRILPWDGLPSEAMTLALSPDGTVLAVGDRSGAVTLIDTKTGKKTARLESPSHDAEGTVWSLAFSPTGNQLAVGTQQGHVDVWSLAETSAPLFRLPGHRGYVSSLAFDAQGRYLASAGSDKTVDVWDLLRIREESKKMGLAW
jgi:WD40 repeat protein